MSDLYSKDRPKLDVGNRCWYLHDNSLYIVEIVKIRTYYEDNETLKFQLFEVKGRSTLKDAEPDKAHRAPLFLFPVEKELLHEELNENVHRMQRLIGALDIEVDAPTFCGVRIVGWEPELGAVDLPY